MKTAVSTPARNGSGALTRAAHETLRAHLHDGRLRAGAFLSMPMLVETLGLPLAAVREAVKRAEAAGLVTVVPKRGIAVMEADADTTRECLDLRAVLETEGARRRLLCAGPPDLTELRRQHEEMLARARQSLANGLPRQAIAGDLSLHDRLSGWLDSALMTQLYADNRSRIAIIQNVRPFLPDRIVPAMEEHLRIIAALEAGDIGRATEAIRQHLHQTMRWWGVEP